MPNNKSATLTIKSSNNNLIPLYPLTLTSRIIGNNFGNIYGPYNITLNSNNWINNQQVISLNGVISTDILQCTNILSGTIENMKLQNYNYSLIDPVIGINSQDGNIIFTCITPPSIDLQLQIIWTR